MIRRPLRRALCLLALAMPMAAQDSTGVDTLPAPVPQMPHALAIDSMRIAPFRHVYDMRVTTSDSAVSIGERVVALARATYNGDSAWLVTETRTGLVPSSDSLILTSTLRPLHWSAIAGLAHFGAEFVGDSIYGVTTGPTGRQNIVMARRPDLIASGSMLEALLAALPLAPDFHDSVSVLDVTLTSSAWNPGEIAVVGEEDLVQPDAAHACWVVALREQGVQALYWIEKASGATLRMQQQLPPDVGGQLDYLLRPDTSVVAP